MTSYTAYCDIIHSGLSHHTQCIVTANHSSVFGLTFVGYSIDNDELGCIVTSYPDRDVHGFLDCVKSSLTDMKSVLDGKDFK